MDELAQDYYNENLRLKVLLKEQEQQMQDMQQLETLSADLERYNDRLRAKLQELDAGECQNLEEEIKPLSAQLKVLQQSRDVLKVQYAQVNYTDQARAAQLELENERLKKQILEMNELIKKDENYTGNLIQQYSRTESITRLTQQFADANEYEDAAYDSCLRDFRECFPYFKALFASFPVVSSVSKQFAYCRAKTLDDVDFLCQFGVPHEVAIRHGEQEALLLNHFHNNWNDIFESHLILWVEDNVHPIYELVGQFRPLDKKMFEVDERDLDCNLVTNFLIVTLVLYNVALSFDNGICFKRGKNTWFLEV